MNRITNAMQIFFKPFYKMSDAFIKRLPKELSVSNVLIFCVLALLSIGTVMIASASMPYAETKHMDTMYYVLRQFIYIAVAFGVAVFAYSIRPKIWFEHSMLFTLIVLVLLILVLFAKEINGARRWIEFFGIRFQPSELAKFVIVAFTAEYVVRRADEVRSTLWSLARLSIPVGCVIGFILVEPDLGAATVIFITAIVIFYLAGAPVKTLLSTIGALGIFLLIFLLSSSFRRERLMSFTDPFADPLSSGYQLKQSLIAFGRGEWTGVGLGHSLQKLSYLPEAHTDFLLAILAEEFGLMGIAVVLILSFGMVICCMRIAHQALLRKEWRLGYLAYGVATIFLLQICVNAGMNMGLIPPKGLTLPFISFGGSSLVVCALMIGILLRIDKDNKQALLQQNGQ